MKYKIVPLYSYGELSDSMRWTTSKSGGHKNTGAIHLLKTHEVLLQTRK